MGKTGDINTTDERLQEMKDIKEANAKILVEINEKQAKLDQDKAAFAEQKQADLIEIADKRKLLAREEANLAAKK